MKNSSSNKASAKVGRYLLYALGEIFLVVIGILIALQINNWNQDRIETRKEIFHLQNILTSLQNDLENQILPCIEKTEQQISGFDLLRTGFYENDNISNDSIRQLFFQFLGQWDLVLNTVAFENLKSSGMDILSSDSIKIKLLTLYGKDYEYIKDLQSQYDKVHYDNVTKLLSNNLIDMWEELSDEDKQILKNDKQLYLGMKSDAHYSLPNYLNELKLIKLMSKELIENIREEIKHLKKK